MEFFIGSGAADKIWNWSPFYTCYIIFVFFYLSSHLSSFHVFEDFFCILCYHENVGYICIDISEFLTPFIILSLLIRTWLRNSQMIYLHSRIELVYPACRQFTSHTSSIRNSSFLLSLFSDVELQKINNNNNGWDEFVVRPIRKRLHVHLPNRLFADRIAGFCMAFIVRTTHHANKNYTRYMSPRWLPVCTVLYISIWNSLIYIFILYIYIYTLYREGHQWTRLWKHTFAKSRLNLGNLRILQRATKAGLSRAQNLSLPSPPTSVLCFPFVQANSFEGLQNGKRWSLVSLPSILSLSRVAGWRSPAMKITESHQ